MVLTLLPGIFPNWMQKLKNGAYSSQTLLVRCLHTVMTEDEAGQTFDIAVKAGILVSKTKGKQMLFKFSHKVCKQKLEKDPYCFECLLPTVAEPVEKCLLCTRSFHVDCQRKNPMHPMYSVPSDKCQPHQFPPNESDIEESNDEDEAPAATAASYELDCNSNINIISRNSFKHEPDSSDDVYFVSEQPGRKRRRCSTYVKNEEDPNEANDNLKLCTPCRLQKFPDLLTPPHVSVEELNCLLGYLWEKHHSWLKTDVRKYIKKNWSVRDANAVINLFFDKNDILGIADISSRIKSNKFHHLSEFLIDVLVLQVNIGVFFGTKCEEYDATKWLVRDITHDIREISRCSDCYRHSTEPQRSKFWFAKPCTQRHELVFAKQHGFPYWPAKIIRVMSKKSNIFDVRFFGGDHSRAQVRDIRPIDDDISQLKIKATPAYTAAMKELQCHKLLLPQPMTLFSFNADPREAEAVINQNLPFCQDPSEVSSYKKRCVTPASTYKRKRAAATATTPSLPKRIQPPNRRCSMVLRSETLQDTISLATSDTPSPTFEMQRTGPGYQELIQENVSLNEQLTRNKEELDKLKEELKAVKRQNWCQHCLEEASFHCCFTASYCSDACKRRDKRRHKGDCVLNGKT